MVKPAKIKIFFRWIIFLLFLIIFIESIGDFGRRKVENCKGNFYAKWVIFYTHWTMIICGLNSFLAAALITWNFNLTKSKSELIVAVSKALSLTAAEFGMLM